MSRKLVRGYLTISGADLVVFLALVALIGGLIIYVVLPWLWKVAIKPALLWMLT